MVAVHVGATVCPDTRETPGIQEAGRLTDPEVGVGENRQAGHGGSSHP